MKKLIFILCTLVALWACSDKDDPTPVEIPVFFFYSLPVEFYSPFYILQSPFRMAGI